MCHAPLVSVIMPAYNAAAWIGAAISSALAQTYSPLEVLVVDDGSTDETAHIVEEMARRDGRVTLLRQPNGGVARARNLAIARARGQFIAPLDADDLWMPDKIARQVAVMEQGGPNVGLVYTWWLGMDEGGQVVETGAQWNAQGQVLEALLYCNFIGNASVPLFRREALARVGGYDAQLRERGAQGCEDWDISLRIAQHFEVRCVPGYLSYYRNVSGSMAKNCAAMARSHAWVAQSVRLRHPEVPDEVFRWSRGLLLLWLTGLSYHDGNYRESLRWSLRLLRVDPAAATSPWVLQTLSRSLLWLIFRPFAVNVWPNRQAYTSWKHKMRGRFKNTSPLSPADEGSASAPQPGEPPLSPASAVPLPGSGTKRTRPRPKRQSLVWSPAFWRQYDRICLRRWEHLTKPSSRHD